MLPVPQASSILASLGQAAFLWDLTADTIAWSDNAGVVFTDIPAEALASGAGFARLIEPAQSIRTEALAQSASARGGEGVAYRIEYGVRAAASAPVRSEEHTSELQSRGHLVCRLLLEKKNLCYGGGHHAHSHQ